MRVLFQSYYDFARMYGGGPSVVYNLADELSKLGVQITFHDYWKHDPKDFDIVHYFSCYQSNHWLSHRDSDPPLVVTPISWFVLEWRKRIERRAKLIVRALRYGTANRRMLGYPFEVPRRFFPNSEGESRHLSTAHGISRSKMVIIPHGVSGEFQEGDANKFEELYHLKNFVLCVGRFEFPRKNQLALIRALKNDPIPLVFLGGPELGHEGYFERCRSEAGPNTLFLPPVSRDSTLLLSAYHASKVVALPALLESPGLTGLEGGLAGANIAVTQSGSTREYYGPDAWYFDPRDISSIRRAVLEAFESPKRQALRTRIVEQFTWNKIAERQKRAYEDLLNSTPGS